MMTIQKSDHAAMHRPIAVERRQVFAPLQSLISVPYPITSLICIPLNDL